MSPKTGTPTTPEEVSVLVVGITFFWWHWSFRVSKYSQLALFCVQSLQKWGHALRATSAEVWVLVLGTKFNMCFLAPGPPQWRKTSFYCSACSALQLLRRKFRSWRRFVCFQRPTRFKHLLHKYLQSLPPLFLPNWRHSMHWKAQTCLNFHKIVRQIVLYNRTGCGHSRTEQTMHPAVEKIPRRPFMDHSPSDFSCQTDNLLASKRKKKGDNRPWWA